MVSQERFLDQIARNAPWCRAVAQPGSGKGKRLLICGAGPSLADHLDAMDAPDEVWACNSALPFLMDRGIRVTHGFAIDQGAEMLRAEEWARTFPVTYLLASSVHPSLVQHLAHEGRSVTFFHNYLGVPDPVDWVPVPGIPTAEMFHYCRLYPPTAVVGRGLNAAIRAVCLAQCLDFTEIAVVGADCAAAPDSPPMPGWGSGEVFDAWLESVMLYADGRTAAEAFGTLTPMAQTELEGRRWVTRPDMVVSARHLLELMAEDPRIQIVGDTMVAAMQRQGPAYLADLPQLGPDGTITHFRAQVTT